jgi:hypothetical protein
VITMAMIGKVRRMHLRDGKSVREIVRLTSLARTTARKWLRAPLQGEPKYRRKLRPTKLTPYQQIVKQALKADVHRLKRDRRTAKKLYVQLKAAGYGGGYSRLTDVIRAWLTRGARAKVRRWRRRPSCRWSSSRARRSSSTGARKGWWWAASTTGRRWLT